MRRFPAHQEAASSNSSILQRILLMMCNGLHCCFHTRRETSKGIAYLYFKSREGYDSGKLTKWGHRNFLPQKCGWIHGAKQRSEFPPAIQAHHAAAKP